MNPKHFVTDLLQFTARLIPSSFFPRWVQRDFISIFYHAVSDAAMDHVQYLYPVVPVDAFKEALKTMRERFIFVTYYQLQDHCEKRKPLPPKAVNLSFDDGFVECYHFVRPILLEMHIPCTIFLTIDWLDNQTLYFRHELSLCVARFNALDSGQQQDVIKRINQHFGLSLKDNAAFISWLTGFREADEEVLEEMRALFNFDPANYLATAQPYLTTIQVREMDKEGFTIGAHGLSHRKLGFIPREEVEYEIVESCNKIQAITGQQVVPFSFPQSAGNLDRSQLADIRARNPQVGLLFDTKDLRLDAPFMVNRIWAERPLTPERKLHPITEILADAYREAWVEDLLIRGRRWF